MRGATTIVGERPAGASGENIDSIDDTNDGFSVFFVDAEPRLRRALVARLGGERGREASAEALAWGFEHWADVRLMANGVGYLYRVGVSRTRGRRALPAVAMASETIAAPVEPEPMDPEVWSALWTLSDNQRVAVVLVHGYGWTMREVGELLGVSVPTVGTHLRRGLVRLRTTLGHGVDNEYSEGERHD